MITSENSTENKILWDNIYLPISELKPAGYNPRKLSEAQRSSLKKSLKKFNLADPIVINADRTIIGGHQRIKVLLELGYSEPLACRAPSRQLSVEEEKELNLRLNKNVGEFDFDLLADFGEEMLAAVGFDAKELEQIFQLNPDNEQHKKLQDRFLVPPFSVLDARQEYWQERKRAWLSLGIESECGRGDNLLNMSPQVQATMNGKAYGKTFGTEGNIAGEKTGTSIFDPVICELAYKWFMQPGHGSILDPFAGGSVRGIVASKLGKSYVGIDLRQEQVEANQAQAKKICTDPEDIQPVWFADDSLRRLDIIADKFDLIFTCPPYGSLEKYSDNPQDLSAMPHDKFIDIYRKIIAKSCRLLKDDSFAVCVVGDFRDEKGFYRNFVSETIAAFESAGLRLYNEAILVTSIGTLAIRAARMFNAGRKLGKGHQNVLCFYKGNPKNIKDKFGELDFSGLADSPDTAGAGL